MYNYIIDNYKIRYSRADTQENGVTYPYLNPTLFF